MRRPFRRATTALLAATVLLTACASDDEEPTTPTEDGAADDGTADDGTGDDAAAATEGLNAAIAGYDLAVGEEQRLIAGLLSDDAVLLAYGEVEFQIGYLGAEPTDAEVELGEPVTASYLPVPGIEPDGDPAGSPALLIDQPGAGVYEAFVDFPEAGWYGLRVVAELEDGTTREAQATFPVQEAPQVPAVGDDAPRSDNLTIADVESGEAMPVMVDSRAQAEDAEIPDPQIHDTTVAEAIEAGTPSVVVLSTPTYCVSTFCGPLTDTVADLADEYEGVAEVIHIEVWRDFEASELNDAAAEWIQTDSGGNEPWVFLVDGDGVIQARWDNVLDLEQLRGALDEL